MPQAAADLVIREATGDDVEAIVRLHEADTLGGHGDAWTPEREAAYRAAFAAIQASPDNSLHVACEGAAVVGTFQLTLIPGLTGGGRLRAKLESVQVAGARRSGGIGARMVAHAMGLARARGAGVLELSSNKRRTDAHRFYERLGFVASHIGMKLQL
jgi:GNAT superfamily N-acetyltransferase